MGIYRDILPLLFPVCQYLYQLFHIQAGESKPNFHGHLFFTYQLRVSHSVMLFSCTKITFYGFLPHGIDCFHSQCVANIFTLFNIFMPDMPSYDFNMFSALSALAQIRAAFTYIPFAFVLSVAISVGRCVLEDFVIWTYVAIIVFVIYKLVFTEVSFLGLRSCVRHQRCYSLIYQKLCYGRCFVACIHYHCLCIEFL